MGMESVFTSSRVSGGRNGSGFWRQRILGLQGKLIVGFSLVLLIALGTSSWLSVQKSRLALSDILGEQARQIAQTLAMAAEMPYELNDVEELQRLGKDLLRSRNIVLVAFYDPNGQAMATACRDPDLMVGQGAVSANFQANVQHLMQVRHRDVPALGEFLELTAPVFNNLHDSRSRRHSDDSAAGNTHLVGYLTVGISQNAEQAQFQRVTLLGVGMGCLIFLVCLPLASGLVHRIIQPIRQLARASNRIASGDFEVHVAADRPDEIGVLARSFNEMAQRIREQQQELREANRDLEEKVCRRTAELEASNRRLSAEIAEKEDFLRAVSHDLNAPLRNISGMAAMLLMKHRERFDEEIIHRLERIQKNVEVETDLISELLELSRIKTRRQKRESVDLDALVRDIAGVFEDDLKSQRITVSVDQTLPALVCERARLRQVFQNLIDNAIKYMGEGPVREVHIGYAEAGDDIEFYVRDTGIGIDKEDLSKVFRVFRRGRNSAEMKVAGKGVGLASVKSIVETYNGRIWVESEVGQGTTFRFTLHRDQARDADDAEGDAVEASTASAA
jgi:signal transduction histidine kinase